jgi:hypothetical protein
MTVGLPGTGIGGIFYLLLAVCMPIRESVRTLKGQTNLRRWSFIALQLLFVLGIAAAKWSELWVLNRSLMWTWETLKVNGPLLMSERTFSQTNFMALASASASFISLTFVITGVHILRFFVHRTRRGQHLATPKNHTTFQILKPTSFTPTVP